MAFLFITVSSPCAFATEQVSLTEANVVSWPTIEGEIFFGQRFGDGLSLSGGVVTTDGTEAGTVIDGKFEFIDENFVPTNTEGYASIKFTPSNKEYSSFEIPSARKVIYSVNPTTPVLVDENSPPIATPVEEAGNRLSTSTISGGAVKNPYTGETLAGEWYWVSKRTKVEEGGYFPAELGVGLGYNVLTMDVYVGIVGDAVETEISELPTISETVYSPSLRWENISLIGGKAVALGTENEILGTFSHSKVGLVTGGTHTIDVKFTPNDINTAKSSTCQITVTINKAPIRFVDENGNDIVPEITVPYGTDFNYIPQLLKPYVKGAEYTLLSLGDLENTKVTEGGTYTVTASAPSEGANYEKTELSFKIIIEKQKLNPKLYAEPGKLYIQDTSGAYRPEGTFTFTYYINDVEQGSIEGIKYLERFDWNPTKSGEYEYKIVYVEATENEHYIIEPFSVTNPLTLSWAFKAPGAVEGTQYPYGSEVALEAPATDPEKADKPYYGFVKWEDVNGNTGLTEEELANREITFTMPDGEVELKATYEFDFCLFIQYYVQIVVDWFNSFFQSLGTLF